VSGLTGSAEIPVRAGESRTPGGLDSLSARLSSFAIQDLKIFQSKEIF